MIKTFIVLGMHRSATSLAAQGLYRCGVNIGKYFIESNESNPYGHYEDRDFVVFNSRILKLAGGSWFDPPQERAILRVGENIADEIRDFVNKKKSPPFWGWKDPRTTLTIRCYLPYIDNAHFIACYRKPVEIAESLFKRDKIPVRDGIDLARVYNHRLKLFMEEFTAC